MTGRFGGRHPYSRPLDWASVRRRLCYGKWLMLFPLKLQRNNRQNALAVDPAKGKTGKRLYFHRTVEMRQPHAMTGPRRKKPLFVVGSQRGPPYMGELRCRLILKSGGYGFPLIRAHRQAAASARRSFLHNIRHVAAYAYGGGPEGRS